MLVTAPPTLTAAGLSPDRADRATFVARSIARDDFIKNIQIPQLQTAIDNVFNNATEAYNSGVSATANAASSAINASQAAAAAAAIQWVSGTTYAVGDARWSPATKISYRRLIAGAGTTDPSADATNWAAIVMPLAAGGTGATTAAAARTALGITTPTAFRNRVINGDMAIDQAQLSVSATLTAGGVLRRLCDQFYGYCTGANITAQQITFNGYNRERFTGAASNTGLGFATRLESNNVDDLVSNTATLSLRVSSTNITALTWTAYYANTTNVFGTLATPTRTQIATGTFTINGVDATYSAQMAVPAGAHTGIEIVFTTGALLGSQTIEFGDIQLEKGAVTTADTVFEVVEKGTQLARCQYHYERVVILVTATGSFVQQTSYRQKRAVPALTIGSFSAGTGATVANSTQGGITTGLYQSANHSQTATADVYVDAGLF